MLNMEESVRWQISRSTLSQLSEEEALKHAVCGLTEEAGEVSGLLKREAFKQINVPIERWREELGDVLWYLIATAQAKGLTLEEIFRSNEEKLRQRYGNF